MKPWGQRISGCANAAAEILTLGMSMLKDIPPEHLNRHAAGVFLSLMAHVDDVSKDLERMKNLEVQINEAVRRASVN